MEPTLSSAQVLKIKQRVDNLKIVKVNFRLPTQSHPQRRDVKGQGAAQAGGERQKQTGTCGGIAFAPIWTCATVPRDRGLPARRRNQALRESLGAAVSSWRQENGSERPHGWWT